MRPYDFGPLFLVIFVIALAALFCGLPAWLYVWTVDTIASGVTP